MLLWGSPVPAALGTSVSLGTPCPAGAGRRCPSPHTTTLLSSLEAGPGAVLAESLLCEAPQRIHQQCGHLAPHQHYHGVAARSALLTARVSRISASLLPADTHPPILWLQPSPRAAPQAPQQLENRPRPTPAQRGFRGWMHPSTAPRLPPAPHTSSICFAPGSPLSLWDVPAQHPDLLGLDSVRIFDAFSCCRGTISYSIQGSLGFPSFDSSHFT